MVMDMDMDILQDLNEQQKEVCEEFNNCVLTACPGSGKTRTIVYRLAYLCQKHPDSKKLNIAITYTNKAAEEMERRLRTLDINTDSVWVGTIHQFCMEYIIRPYSMYCPRLKFGYRIIDQYEKDSYHKLIKKNLGDIDDKKICIIYKNILIKRREIDFDDILDIAYSLIQDKPFICENIASIIRSINIDEYQDTREIQYNILAKLVRKNATINVLFVGDVNQSIYTELGGVAKSVEDISMLFGVPFVQHTLSGCYRSTQRLIDFYSSFAIHPDNIVSLSEQVMSAEDCLGHISYNKEICKNDLSKSIAELIKRQLSCGIPESEICVAVPQKYLLYPVVKDLYKLLPDTNFDAPDFTPFKKNPLNPFYLIAWIAFSKDKELIKLRKKRVQELISLLKEDYGIFLHETIDYFDILDNISQTVFSTRHSDGVQCYQAVVKNLFLLMNISLKSEKTLNCNYHAFVNEMNERIEKNRLSKNVEDFEKCFNRKRGIVITTIHSLKGEEYTTVIAFGLLNGMVPNWRYCDKTIKRRSIVFKLLYVLFSRSKKNLYLISEQGRCTSGRQKYTPTDELVEIDFEYDLWPR